MIKICKKPNCYNVLNNPRSTLSINERSISQSPRYSFLVFFSVKSSNFITLISPEMRVSPARDFLLIFFFFFSPSLLIPTFLFFRLYFVGAENETIYCHRPMMEENSFFFFRRTFFPVIMAVKSLLSSEGRRTLSFFFLST